MKNHLYSFDSREALHGALAKKIAKILKTAIDKEGKALMAVSGGSTPKPLFETLSGFDLAWDKVVVTLVDERWVDEDHPDSNAKLVKDYLLHDKVAAVTFIPLKNDAPDPFAGVERCCETLQSLGKPFDVVVLGMGGDAHTASFFPGDENLHNALTTESICAATIPTDAPHQRMTLSLRTLLEAGHLFLHIEGEAKKSVYDQALEDGPVETMPIRSVLQDPKALEVYYAS